MKICLLVEGAYPYTSGGVSSWLVHLMKSIPQHEFVVQVISSHRKQEDTSFQCEIPDNLTQINEIYMLDHDYVLGKNHWFHLSRRQYTQFKNLMFGDEVDWKVIFRYFTSKQVSLNRLLSSKEFFDMSLEYYNAHFERMVFADFLWTMRSMYLPLYTALKAKPIQADIYHSVSTGYAGILGCMYKNTLNKPLILTEHGIYTREREEEIIKAEWVKGTYKDLWINQFKKISKCCYEYSDKVISLFEAASEFQGELGCSEEKRLVIPNGVDANDLKGIAGKDENDTSINLGAILRVTPIKDVKTMISAFGLAKKSEPRLKLWIMGPLDENPDYVEECKQLVKEFKIEDIEFTGRINIRDYIGKMDILMLSSLSEGQPLAMLEGFAAKKPCIATNVGNCPGLIHGEMDNLGDSGIIVPVMNVHKMAKAILQLSKNDEMRKEMGQIGYKRVTEHYRQKDVFSQYVDLYNLYNPNTK